MKDNDNMGNVIDFSTRLYPVGSMALHPEYGIVDVFAANGFMRGIIYQHCEALPLDGESEEVLFSENIEFLETWVPVRELREADLSKDILLAIKRGEIPASETGLRITHD
ncbi:MAG: hypothetical protein HOP04_02175 [Methylophilaceae bacterium]|nr:hypothetical protein [Methylophilaceae bacterium]